MSRLVWIETLDGWRSGRYQIELAAPQLWVLTRRPKRCDDSELTRTELVRTAGSLRELKRAAAELEGSRRRRRGLLAHLAVVILLMGIAVTASVLGWGLTIPAVIALFAIMLRILAIWVESATGSAWSRVPDIYQ